MGARQEILTEDQSEMKINDLQNVSVGQQGNGFEVERQGLLISCDFLPPFVAAQSKAHWDAGWAAGRLGGFRGGAESGNWVSLGVSSSWPWWRMEEIVGLVYLTTTL